MAAVDGNVAVNGASHEYESEVSISSESDADTANDCIPMGDESGSEEDNFEDGVSGMSPAQVVFNIVKNIVGEGMLSLPAGLAAGTGVFIGCLITTFFCLMLGYTFAAMGSVCHATGARNHKDASLRVSGPGLANFMTVILALKTTSTCVSYAIVIGESYSRILHFFGIHGWYSSRQAVLVLFVVAILLPLCLQRDLSVLSYTSLFGICCEIFVVAFMQFRLLDDTYAPGGKYYDEIPPEHRLDWGVPNQPHVWRVSITTFILLASLSTAFIAHYNAPKFYVQMRNRSPRRFRRVVVIAFVVSLLIYIWVMTVGYLTFGKNCSGLILNNYSETDPWATAARVAIAFAVLFGFPLAFTSLRDSVMAFLNMPQEKKRNWAPTTLVLLAIVTIMGSFLSDLGLVNALGGAIFGSLITLVFPAKLVHGVATTTQADRKKSGYNTLKRLKGEKLLAVFILAFGLCLCLLGSTIVLLKKYAPQVLKASG